MGERADQLDAALARQAPAKIPEGIQRNPYRGYLHTIPHPGRPFLNISFSTPPLRPSTPTRPHAHTHRKE